MIIDSHVHLVPPALLEAIRSEAARFPSVRAIEDHGSLAFSFAGGLKRQMNVEALDQLTADGPHTFIRRALEAAGWRWCPDRRMWLHWGRRWARQPASGPGEAANGREGEA